MGFTGFGGLCFRTCANAHTDMDKAVDADVSAQQISAYVKICM